jgi:hypothetical protein
MSTYEHKKLSSISYKLCLLTVLESIDRLLLGGFTSPTAVKRKEEKQSVVVNRCDPSTSEAEAGRSQVLLRPCLNK